MSVFPVSNRKFFAGVTAGAVLFCSIAGRLDGAANPYHFIPKRNVFKLRAKEPVRVPKPVTPMLTVTLTGITTILNGKRALLKVEFPAIPPKPASVKSYVLAEGQKSGPIEVLEIDEKSSVVKLNNSGTIMAITFPKLPPAPMPTPVPRARRFSRTLPLRTLAR